jgi:hypothetical protein
VDWRRRIGEVDATKVIVVSFLLFDDDSPSPKSSFICDAYKPALTTRPNPTIRQPTLAIWPRHTNIVVPQTLESRHLAFVSLQLHRLLLLWIISGDIGLGTWEGAAGWRQAMRRATYGGVKEERRIANIVISINITICSWYFAKYNLK